MTTEEKTTYQRLIVERRGPVGWIINNRPERLNAYDIVMREEFPRAWAELDADPALPCPVGADADVVGAVCTGSGGL